MNNNCQMLIAVLGCWTLLTGVANVKSSNADKTDRAAFYKKLYAIETGYVKQPGQHGSRTDESSKDLLEQYIAEDTDSLRCFFKLVGLSYLQITKYLLKLDAHDRIDDTVDAIESLGRDALAMITAFGNLRLPAEYDLWMFHMYTAKIRSFRDFYRRNDRGVGDKQTLFDLSDVHENVAKQLEANAVGCAPNRFDVTGPGSELYDRFKTVRFTVGNYDGALELLHEYRQQLAVVMDENLSLAAFTDNGGTYDPDRLFLLADLVMGNDHLGNGNLDNLMSAYDPYIDWGDAQRTVRGAYRDAVGSPMVLYGGMKDLKKYHVLVKDAMTVILLRMIWTHVELVRKKFESKNTIWDVLSKVKVDKINKKVFLMINEFVRVMSLDGGVLHDLVECLAADSWTCIAGGQGTIIIKNQLDGLSFKFPGLDATTGPVVGDEQAFSSKVVQLMSFADSAGISTKHKNKKITPNSAIEYNFIRGIIFVNHLEKLCASVDYELIKTVFNSVTFIPYDDINIEQFLNDQTTNDKRQTA